MSAGTYQQFMLDLGKNESGNNYEFSSSLGYLGRFQFGEEALKVIGFYGGDSTSAIDFSGSWTSTAAAYSVTSASSFLQSPAAQDAAATLWFAKVHDDAASLGLDTYVGRSIAGVLVTESGLLAGGHLVGVWNLKTYLETGGAVDTRDGYGTPVSEYVERFGGFDTPFAPSATNVPSNGDDRLAASASLHVIHGGEGDDTIDGSGASSSTYLRGDAGADLINGGGGFDDINGNAGADTAHGGGGDDWVVGGKDNDRLSGDEGADIVWGNLGDDTADGGSGADQVRGGQGNDLVLGGAGDDWLSGDRDADTLTGGAGADTFHTWRDAGLDLVTDFHVWEGDRVMLDPGTAYTVSQVGADTVIDMGGGGQMILQGVSLASLQSGWIV